LLNDPSLQATLHALKDFIVVNISFNVNHLENILYFHPNEFFVSSVIHGLHNGFWPLNFGKWEDSLYDKTENYTNDLQDINEIRAFCDHEVTAKCWSLSLPDGFTLLPDMKVSPMFVV
ncbi:uncharacterized protein BT62DRAFT_886459, partial [Guyanagaster necrorhizus]